VRIINGQFKRRNIVAPSNLPVRPTTDFAKEGIFSILNNYYHFDEISVLDLFAGTGNISYEFASRGVSEVIAVDIHHGCVNFIRSTASDLGMGNLRVVKADVFKFLANCSKKFNVIFADPPYESDNIAAIPDLVFQNQLLQAEGLLVLEHNARLNFKKHPFFYEERNYGKVHFSLFSPEVKQP